MRIKAKIKAFTLIELLVVITIIGILATGATAIYTSQIQKARDSTRISSTKAMQSAIEQVYQDSGEYPQADEFITEVGRYLETFPSDPKHAQPCNDGGVVADAPDCAFAYITGPDTNGIEFGEYEISLAFENEGNVDARAKNDTGDDDVRLEQGINTATNNTTVAKDSITEAPGACILTGGEAVNGTDLIIINGNPTTAGQECN